MGKREEQDALKAVKGEFQCGKSRETILDRLLRPFRALKYKLQERSRRKQLLKQLAASDAVEVKYEPASDVSVEGEISKDNWLYDLASEDDTKTKEK